jgi:DNA-binding IclR family transcriptional regulator
MENSGSLLGLRRGLKALEIFAASENGLTFNQIKDAFDDLVPSTVSRLLKVLTDEEMIKLDHQTKRYLLADRSHEMANLIKGKVSIAQKMQPHLNRLGKETGLSSAFFQYESGKAVLVAKSEQPEAFHYAAIGTFPASFKHAFKQICFAHVQEKSQSDDFDQNKLKEIRQLPVLVSKQDDHPGLTRIAAPVFLGNDKECAGAIGISFYQKLNNQKLEKLAAIVKNTAQNF